MGQNNDCIFVNVYQVIHLRFGNFTVCQSFLKVQKKKIKSRAFVEGNKVAIDNQCCRKSERRMTQQEGWMSKSLRVNRKGTEFCRMANTHRGKDEMVVVGGFI